MIENYFPKLEKKWFEYVDQMGLDYMLRKEKKWIIRIKEKIILDSRDREKKKIKIKCDPQRKIIRLASDFSL